MPKIPIDEVPAGPGMDIAVALTLGLGDIFQDGSNYYVASNRAAFQRMKETGRIYEQAGHFCYPLATYSTDIAAAWKLAETYKHGGFGVGWSESWGVPYCMMGDAYEYGDTVPLAICRAFLKANGVEFVEVTDAT